MCNEGDDLSPHENRPLDGRYWEEHWQSLGEDAIGEVANPYVVAETSGLGCGTALDAGCGAGAEAVWLAEQGWDVTGADISPAALAKARRRAEASAELPIGVAARRICPGSGRQGDPSALPSLVLALVGPPRGASGPVWGLGPEDVVRAGSCTRPGSWGSGPGDVATSVIPPVFPSGAVTEGHWTGGRAPSLHIPLKVPGQGWKVLIPAALTWCIPLGCRGRGPTPSLPGPDSRHRQRWYRGRWGTAPAWT